MSFKINEKFRLSLKNDGNHHQLTDLQKNSLEIILYYYRLILLIIQFSNIHI